MWLAATSVLQGDALVTGVVLSRAGLWIFDLAAAQVRRTISTSFYAQNHVANVYYVLRHDAQGVRSPSWHKQQPHTGLSGVLSL